MIRREMRAHLEDRRRHFQWLADGADTPEWQSIFLTYVEFYDDIIATVSARSATSSKRTLRQGQTNDFASRSFAAISSGFARQ